MHRFPSDSTGSTESTAGKFGEDALAHVGPKASELSIDHQNGSQKSLKFGNSGSPRTQHVLYGPPSEVTHSLLNPGVKCPEP